MLVKESSRIRMRLPYVSDETLHVINAMELCPKLCMKVSSLLQLQVRDRGGLAQRTLQPGRSEVGCLCSKERRDTSTDDSLIDTLSLTSPEAVDTDP